MKKQNKYAGFYVTIICEKKKKKDWFAKHLRTEWLSDFKISGNSCDL